MVRDGGEVHILRRGGEGIHLYSYRRYLVWRAGTGPGGCSPSP